MKKNSRFGGSNGELSETQITSHEKFEVACNLKKVNYTNGS